MYNAYYDSEGRIIVQYNGKNVARFEKHKAGWTKQSWFLGEWDTYKNLYYGWFASVKRIKEFYQLETIKKGDN